MKVALLLGCTYAAFCTQSITSAAIKAPLSIISLDDLTESERKHLEYLDSQYYPRPKRSGDLISLLKETIGHGIKSKLGTIARGSASAISHLSSGSSGHDHSYHHYDIPETYDHKSFDFWSLKKSILNTLLQAVKAIKGGVIAVKGQLIKGSGHLISAKGKLISAKGEAITSLGKHIASSALLSPFKGHSASGHDEYAHYGHSAPSAEYGAPSAPGPEYQAPEHYHSAHHEEPHGGILILKKIPTSGRDHSSHHKHEESKIPDFKPIEPTGPSFSSIIGKFFSASSSLKPDEPALFGHTATGYTSHDHPPLHSESHDHHHSSHSHHDEHPHDDHPHDFGPSSSSHISHHDSLPPLTHSTGDHSKPPSTSYGIPFEEAPNYLNFDEHTSASKKNPLAIAPHSTNPVKIMSTSSNPTAETKKPLTATPDFNEIIKPSAPSNFASNNVFVDSSLIDNSKNKPNLFIDMNLPINPHELPNIESFPPYPGHLPPEFIAKHGLQNINPTLGTNSNFNSFQNTKQFLPTPLGNHVAPTASGLNAYSSHAPNSFSYNGLIDNVPSPTHQIPAKRPTHVRPRHIAKHNNKKQPNFDVVRSIAFELGPNGPKRL